MTLVEQYMCLSRGYRLVLTDVVQNEIWWSGWGQIWDTTKIIQKSCILPSRIFLQERLFLLGVFTAVSQGCHHLQVITHSPPHFLFCVNYLINNRLHLA